jgi:filamentous hemagglutinin
MKNKLSQITVFIWLSLLCGSNLVATNDITIDTHDLNIKSSESTTKSKFGEKDLSGSLSVTMYGGGGAALSLGYGEQHASSDSLTNTNSLVKANTLNITAANDATIKGATLRGDDTVNLKVGNNLSLESK